MMNPLYYSIAEYDSDDMAIIMAKSESRLIRCEKCENCFTTEVGYRRHMNRVHGASDGFLCEVCNKIFFSKGGFGKTGFALNRVGLDYRKNLLYTKTLKFVNHQTLFHLKFFSGLRLF